jgi:transcriptional regulator with XRE-family HTH domain
MSLSSNIKKYRKKKKLTQDQLAKNAAISLITIRRYENENINPTMETLEKIAKTLEITVNELLWDENDFFYLGILKKAGTNRVENFANMMGITYERCLALLSEEEAPTDRERKTLQLIAGLSFEEFLGPIEIDYGTPTEADVSPWQNTLKESLNEAFKQLNAIGQEKAIERVEELTEIPKYKK